MVEINQIAIPRRTGWRAQTKLQFILGFIITNEVICVCSVSTATDH